MIYNPNKHWVVLWMLETTLIKQNTLARSDSTLTSLSLLQ